MLQEQLIRDMEAMITARFGDLVQPQELALLREPGGLEALKRLLSERCRRPINGQPCVR